MKYFNKTDRYERTICNSRTVSKPLCCNKGGTTSGNRVKRNWLMTVDDIIKDLVSTNNRKMPRTVVDQVLQSI